MRIVIIRNLMMVLLQQQQQQSSDILVIALWYKVFVTNFFFLSVCFVLRFVISSPVSGGGDHRCNSNASGKLNMTSNLMFYLNEILIPISMRKKWAKRSSFWFIPNTTEWKGMYSNRIYRTQSTRHHTQANVLQCFNLDIYTSTSI